MTSHRPKIAATRLDTVSLYGIVRDTSKTNQLLKGKTMDITIKSELDGVKMVADYRNMTSALIIHEINCLLIEGHKITGIIDLDSKNKGE